MYSNRYFPRSLPEPLSGLATLAVDMRWSWNHASDALWRKIDPELWESTGNPWFILESVSQTHLESLAVDEEFLSELHHQLAQRHLALSQSTWFAEHIGRDDLTAVAYFSLEFGLNEALPLYSGGLGILAGDFLKTASDLGVPVYGIGLLYQQGYFRQGLDQDGSQLEFYPYNDPAILPITPLRDADGNWIRITVELPGRELNLRAWEARVGRVFLYLLDSNDPLNLPQDRGITEKLYGGGLEVRLQQEIALGIGGWRLLAAKGIDCDICHLNEGHAAFAVLERARSFMEKAGVDFDVALRCTRMGNVFTTHTPVEAAFDRYPIKMIQQYTHDYVKSLGVSLEYLFDLGRSRPGDGNESFNMACLALHGSGAANGVSRLHGEVSREIFQSLFPRWPQGEVPVTHVTNGVHMPSWDSSFSDVLWTESCGKKRWLGSQESIEEEINAIDDQTLWTCRSANRLKLIENVRKRLAQQQAIRGVREKQRRDSTVLLDPNALTIGFARRFATYKRANLIFHDMERIKRILNNPDCPVQIVFSGKAHPADEPGKALIKQIHQLSKEPEFLGKVIFIENYDINIARHLVQSVDLWLNTPRRPNEASGTSGEKAALNAVPNFSVMDGWWVEGYNGEDGWVIGDEREYRDEATQDEADAQSLYNTLETEIIPLFSNRDTTGTPHEWVKRMKASIKYCAPRFSMSRQVKDYMNQLYLPAIKAGKKMSKDDFAAGRALAHWKEQIYRNWGHVHISAERLDIERLSMGECIHLNAQVFLGAISQEDVAVEIVCGWRPEENDELQDLRIIPMTVESAQPTGVLKYTGELCFDTNGKFGYAIRVLPIHSDLNNRYEAALVKWA